MSIRFWVLIVQGFINLNKPAGFTSHDCVARVRRLLRLKKVGHGGTLDPAATGVLPIAVGRATRLLQFLPSGKAYRATICLGVKTATDDLAGEVLSSHPATWLTLEQVQPYLSQFQGTIAQIPPRYSAIHVGGKRLYELARSGIEVEIPVRIVEVDEMTVLDWRSGEFPELEVAITCGAGTYIRSIARDLGEAIGTGGTLAALIRTHSSGFDLENSITLETLAEQLEAETFRPMLPELALAHLPAIELPTALAKRWSQGQKIRWEEIPPAPLLQEDIESKGDQVFYRVCGEGDRFLGIGTEIVSDDEKLLIPKLVWAEPCSS